MKWERRTINSIECYIVPDAWFGERENCAGCIFDDRTNHCAASEELDCASNKIIAIRTTDEALTEYKILRTKSKLGIKE
jgi:hypothetical protein